MKRRGPVFLIVSLMAAFPCWVFAQVSITDIVYDPPGADTGHEWVGVVNTSTSSIRLADFRLRTAGVNHRISAVPGSETLDPGARAAVVQDKDAFATDNPTFIGSVFRASFSLTNKGGTVAITDKSGAVVATRSYVAPPLQPAPPKQKKTSARSAAGADRQDVSSDSVAIPNESVGDATSFDVHSRTASAASAGTMPPMMPWLFGVGALALFGSGMMFLSRRIAKDEWDIVEETERE